MIKYIVKAAFWNNSLRIMEDEYSEKELNKALTNATGLIRECLISKKIALYYVRLFKIIDEENLKEEVLLFYFDSEEYSHRYVIRKLGGNKNEKENVISSNGNDLYDAFN